MGAVLVREARVRASLAGKRRARRAPAASRQRARARPGVARAEGGRDSATRGPSRGQQHGRATATAAQSGERATKPARTILRVRCQQAHGEAHLSFHPPRPLVLSFLYCPPLCPLSLLSASPSPRPASSAPSDPCLRPLARCRVEEKTTTKQRTLPEEGRARGAAGETCVVRGFWRSAYVP